MNSRQRYSVDRASLEKDTRIQFFRGSGPGGQRRNRRETGVRLRHLPSGIAVEAEDTRSQAQNRELAFERLQERLKKLNRPRKRRIPTKPSRSAKEARLKAKKIQGAKKQRRQTPPSE